MVKSPSSFQKKPIYPQRFRMFYSTLHVSLFTSLKTQCHFILQFTKSYAHLNGFSEGIPEELSYPYRNISLVTTVTPKTESSISKSNDDWKIIIYIIIITCCIIFLSFLALCIYRMRLQKSLRANRERRLSKLVRWLQ